MQKSTMLLLFSSKNGIVAGNVAVVLSSSTSSSQAINRRRCWSAASKETRTPDVVCISSIFNSTKLDPNKVMGCISASEREISHFLSSASSSLVNARICSSNPSSESMCVQKIGSERGVIRQKNQLPDRLTDGYGRFISGKRQR